MSVMCFRRVKRELIVLPSIDRKGHCTHRMMRKVGELGLLVYFFSNNVVFNQKEYRNTPSFFSLCLNFMALACMSQAQHTKSFSIFGLALVASTGLRP